MVRTCVASRTTFEPVSLTAFVTSPIPKASARRYPAHEMDCMVSQHSTPAQRATCKIPHTAPPELSSTAPALPWTDKLAVSKAAIAIQVLPDSDQDSIGRPSVIRTKPLLAKTATRQDTWIVLENKQEQHWQLMHEA